MVNQDPAIQNIPDVLLTRAELLEQLPQIGMADSVRLVAVEPDGSQHPANVGYSSDLKAFALMTYDERENITSWYPLPTATNTWYRGYGKRTHIKYPRQEEPADQRDRAQQTLFRIETR